jgi:hypothetical protein
MNLPLRLTLPMVLVVVLGIALRLLGYFDPALQLWVDEASWAEMLVKGTATWIRPAGYMTVSGWLIALANTEPMLRALSLVGGIALVLFAQGIFRRVSTSNAVSAFGVYLLAISPIAVSMSKEFKPYALEAAFHGALIWLVLRWLADHHRKDLIGFVLVAAVAPLFAWSVVFAYPGLFLVVGIEAIRTNRRHDFAISAVGGVTTFAVLLFIFLQRVAGEDEKSGFWGKKYDVFYVGKNAMRGVLWMLRKTLEVAGFPGHLSLGYPIDAASFAEGFLPLIFGVFVLALATLLVVRRRWLAVALWVAPWIAVVLFNVAGKWPYGVFRTNLFLLLYTVGIVVAGIQELQADWSVIAQRRLILGIAFLSVLIAPLNLRRFSVKEENSLALSTSVRTALEVIIDEAKSGDIDVALDGHTYGVFRYYTAHHRDTKNTLGPAYAERRIHVLAGGFVMQKWLLILDGLSMPLAYVVVSKPAFLSPTRAEMNKRCLSFTEKTLTGTTLFRCVRRTDPVAPGLAGARINAEDDAAPADTPTP